MANLKILGGRLKGMSLTSPSEITTRPLQILLKRRIFDRYQDLSGVEFIDLCAGSGAVGLEACSRGASVVHLIEKDKAAYSTLKLNVENAQKRLSSFDQISTHHIDCLKFLTQWWPSYLSLTADRQEQTLLFFAPPYPLHELYQTFLTTLIGLPFHGVLWCEGDHQKSPGQSQISQWMNGHDDCLEHGESFILLKSFP